MRERIRLARGERTIFIGNVLGLEDSRRNAIKEIQCYMDRARDYAPLGKPS